MSIRNGSTKEEHNQRRREKCQAYVRRWAEGKKQQGLCLSCGKERENKDIQHCATCKRKRTSRRLFSLYGITIDEYEELAAYQNHVCWICEKEETAKDGMLHVDHCHKTGKIRGLLCGKCNRGIGEFLDSPRLLKRASDYLTGDSECC